MVDPHRHVALVTGSPSGVAASPALALANRGANVVGPSGDRDQCSPHPSATTPDRTSGREHDQRVTRPPNTDRRSALPLTGRRGRGAARNVTAVRVPSVDRHTR